jgi:serine/threonine-protein kinase
MTESQSSDRIGMYRIESLVGEGGMGQVFLAHDPLRKIPVAIKIMKEIALQNPKLAERFRRELDMAQGMKHRNLVNVYAGGQDQKGRLFMAMEFLPNSLQDIMEKQGQLPVEACIEICSQVADGIQAIHDAGIVHRDIKPQNILIAHDSTPKIADFGIARSDAYESLTTTDTNPGSAYYMSPEQANGDRVDETTDVYALGCTLYHMLTGGPPYPGTSQVQIALQHVGPAYPRPVDEIRDVPESLVRVLNTAISKEKNSRYKTAAEFAKALRSIPLSEPDVAIAAPRAAQSDVIIEGARSRRLSLEELNREFRRSRDAESAPVRTAPSPPKAGSQKIAAGLAAAVVIAVAALAAFLLITQGA